MIRRLVDDASLNVKRIRRSGTGKYTVRFEERVSVANRYLYSSAWSYRTGKRIKSSFDPRENSETKSKSRTLTRWIDDIQNF
jgi:hypothetical protein